jgi:adenylate kinase
MKNIIFIAPPSAGKGTQSKLISEKYNLPHISTGDLLREETSKGTEFGNEIKAIMESGNLVSDEIITKLLENRLSQDDCNNGYILDGYPRNIEQAKIYEELLTKLNKDLGVVIFLDIPRQVALDRVLSRIVCPSCGTSFNLVEEALKPKKEGICDKCGSDLKVRSDDNSETFANRFDTYLNKTQSLIDYYKEKGVLKTIEITAESTALSTFSEIEEIINN